MRIFITGGTGFLGKHLVQKLLQDGHTLLILIPSSNNYLPKLKRTSFLKGNMANINKLLPKIRNFKPEVGIHLAWEGIPNADLHLNLKNLIGGLNCIETLAKAGCKRIFMAGSCHEYGEPGIKVNEKSPLNPFNALYAAKIALYFLGSKIAEAHNVKLIWGRIGFVYGPGQRKASLIPYLLESIRNNRMPILRNPKGGNDFVYVGDVVSAISLLIKKRNLRTNEVYNISSGQLTGVIKIVKIIYNYFKLPLPKNFKEVKLQGFFMDIGKIKRETKWRPKTNLDLGIKKTINFYKNG